MRSLAIVTLAASAVSADIHIAEHSGGPICTKKYNHDATVVECSGVEWKPSSEAKIEKNCHEKDEAKHTLHFMNSKRSVSMAPSHMSKREPILIRDPPACNIPTRTSIIGDGTVDQGTSTAWRQCSTSQVSSPAADAIRDYLITSNVQMGASYGVGKLSASKVDKGYEAGARFINAFPDEIVYGASATQLLRNVALGLSFEQGDEIIVSTLDHEANIAPWLDLADRQRLRIRWWCPEGQGNNPKLTVDSLKPLLSEKTRFLAFSHCTNLLGSIHDVKAIAAAAHEYRDVLVCVDGVAYAPHRSVDVKDLGVDLYCLSWYKVFGPHIAMLYGSREAQKQLQPLGHYFSPTATLSDKAGFAAWSYELIASIPVVVDDLLAQGWKECVQQETEIQTLLLNYLNQRSDVTVYGETSPDPSKRLPIISFTIDGWNSRSVVAAIEANSNLGLKHDHFYSHRLVTEVLDLDATDGVVRVSMAHYNTREEIETVIATLQEIIVKR
ncbi:hypothetical protein F53441_12191 [Fusarium austroafricanum]|uniref:Aminotransferase class V domain-containing protein n=1 Tax=Fusarium austroafricanum TaxID=2364996 RepID=A0A8H4K153_9HYPO|nr:hypothetical protein F53441_12191 [Fusarium austroafricanum]